MNSSQLFRCFFKSFLILLATGSLSTGQAQTTTIQSDADQGWAQFRGSDGTGIASPSAKPPTQWDANKQTAWEVAIPGTGWSSPVYEGDRVWLTTAVTKSASAAEIAAKLRGDRLAKTKTVAGSVEFHAICVDIHSGEIIHDLTLDQLDSPDPINPMNSYASPTPAVLGGKVVCHFGNYGTWCIDEVSGKVIWHKKFVVKHSVGPGSSPVIVDDKVIIVCDGTDLQFIAAVDLETGNQVWKTQRPPIKAADGEYRKSYCTPLLIEVDGKKQAVIPGAQWVASYDPETGAEIWRADHGDGFSIAPMPVYESGLIIFSTGYMNAHFVAVDPKGSGDITDSGIAWRSPPKKAPRMASLIAQSGQIFAMADNGILRCLDAKTGQVLNEKRIGGNFSASPLLAGGNLYFSSREGKVTVVKCSSNLETIATNRFEDSLMASPILVGDDLLIRTEKKLVRIKSSNP